MMLIPHHGGVFDMQNVPITLQKLSILKGLID